jgi:hypothetical protein
LQTLSASIPALPDDLPSTTQDALSALESLSDDELRQVAQSMMPTDQYDRLSELREQRRAGTLSETDEQALAQLMQAADLLTLRKAYAAVLLTWRGHPLSAPTDLAWMIHGGQ